MSEGYITLFVNADGMNQPSSKKPHYKGFIKIEGVDHEFALWPAKDDKKGFSGKYKPKGQQQPQTQSEDSGMPF